MIAAVHIVAAVLFFHAVSVRVAVELVEARLQVLVFVAAAAAQADIAGTVVPVVEAHFVSAVPGNHSVSAEPEFDPAPLVFRSHLKHVR